MGPDGNPNPPKTLPRWRPYQPCSSSTGFHWSSGFEWGGFKRVPRKPRQFCFPIPADLWTSFTSQTKALLRDLSGSCYTSFEMQRRVLVARFWGLNLDGPGNQCYQEEKRGFYLGSTSELNGESQFVPHFSTSGTKGLARMALSARSQTVFAETDIMVIRRLRMSRNRLNTNSNQNPEQS